MNKVITLNGSLADSDTLSALVAMGIVPEVVGGWNPRYIQGYYLNWWLDFIASDGEWRLVIYATRELALAAMPNVGQGQNEFFRQGRYDRTPGFEPGFLPMDDAIEIIRAALKDYVS